MNFEMFNDFLEFFLGITRKEYDNKSENEKRKIVGQWIDTVGAN